MSLKHIVKKVLGRNTSVITYGSEDPSRYSKALKDLMDYYPELKDEKIIMTKDDSKTPFDSVVRKVVYGYDLVNFGIEKYGDDNVSEPFHETLSSGDAIKYRPFPLCVKNMLLTSLLDNLNVYPSTVGSSCARQDLVDYLKREGFPKKNNEYCDAINVHNVAFCGSTTQAFYMILKVIARPGDVIIIPIPTYGIFACIARKQGICLEYVPLRKENDYFVDSVELGRKIDEVNDRLKQKGDKQYGYIPKVVAYLNINPHNPIGNVMTIDNKQLIERIADTCFDKSVFIIDDLIYRDLTYNHKKLAFPIASIPKYFNNTISLFGISKSFGLASLRAGFIVCPTPIFWGFATQVFDFMDSMCVIQVDAVRGAFNGTDKRYKEYDKYFNKLLPRYLYQLDLVNVLINGIDVIEKESTKRKIIKDINHYTNDLSIINKLLKGINGVKIVEKTYPQSGFFVMVDFTDLKGKYYKENQINTENDLLKAIFNKGKVKCLMGENIMWPNTDEFVARVNFAISKDALIHNFYQINRLVEDLKDG